MAEELERELSPVISPYGRDGDRDILAVYEEGCASPGPEEAAFSFADEGTVSYRVTEDVGVSLDYLRPALRVSSADAGSFDDALLVLVGSIELLLRLRMLRDRRLAVFHAASWEVGGACFLLPGPSGSGKTSLSYLAMENGHGVLSEEDSIVVSNDGGFEVMPYPRRLRVPGRLVKERPGAFDVRSADRPYRSFGEEGLLFGYGGRKPMPARLSAVVFLDKDPLYSGEAYLAPLQSRQEAFRMLLANGEAYSASFSPEAAKDKFREHNRMLFELSCEIADTLPIYRMRFDIRRHFGHVGGLLEDLSCRLPGGLCHAQSR
jgi:hypothetical protein